MPAEPWLDVGLEIVRCFSFEHFDQIVFGVRFIFDQIDGFEVLIVLRVGIDCDEADDGIFGEEFSDVGRSEDALQ